MVDTGSGNHFSCSMTAVLVDRVRRLAGEDGVARLLTLANSPRSAEFLCDLANWISFDEAIALYEAGAKVTGEERFAYKIGVEAAEKLAGSPVAALLRSLGSPEAVYGQLTKTASKFNTVTVQEVDEVRPGYARLRVGPREGFPRSRAHCEHTQGLFACTPVLFGLEPARIEHTVCSADGENEFCVYEIHWDPEKTATDEHEDPRVAALQTQLDAMSKRLQGVFATASDLIASDDIDVTLARITDRAALEVRAPSHLLAVRAHPGGELHVHSKNLAPAEAATIAERVLSEDPATLPASWIVAEVRSHRNDYGRLVALYEEGEQFMREEPELLDVYSRYAATALDSATALNEAKRRHAEANALLELARTLASASSRADTAMRLRAAVPDVIDCDSADVFTWDEDACEFVHAPVDQSDDLHRESGVDPKSISALAERLRGADSKAIFIGPDATDRDEREILAEAHAAAAAIVPIRSRDHFLGALVLWVTERPERLQCTPELARLLSGVAAHATSALENSILLDAITHQARHDGLTGLVNRRHFVERLSMAERRADAQAGSFSLFYIDIDLFKSVNDELGHDVGDELLRQVAERLRACVREEDTVARLGGDEYAVLVEGAEDGDAVEAVARRLAAAFEKPFRLRDRTVSIGASIGRANWREHADELDALVRRADSDMYAVKRLHHAATSQTDACSGESRAAA